MKLASRMTCMLLCIAVLLSLAACGASETPEATTAAPIATEAEASPVDIYLSMAEEFMAQEKYDAAIDVLLQAKGESDDPRLDEMLARIEELQRTVLQVDYSVSTARLKVAGVEIRNVTVEVVEETVRYVIDYTAPEGMYLQIPGTNLDACWNYRTPGGEDSFVFELDRDIARDHFSTLNVLFKYSYQNYLRLTVSTLWPDASGEAAVDTAVQIPVTNPSNADCAVHLATVRAVSEDLLHFHVEYTTPRDQQYIAGLSFTESGEDMFFSVGVAPGDDMISFMVDRAEMEAVDAVYVRLFPQDQWDQALVAQLRSDDYTLPQYFPSRNAQEQTLPNSGFSVQADSDRNMRLDSVLIRKSEAGSLYTLRGDFSKLTNATAYCDIGTIYYTSTTRVTDPQEILLFLPAEILTKAADLGIECWGADGYVGFISLPHDYTPVRIAVLQPEAADEPPARAAAPEGILQYPNWSWENQLTHSEVEVFSVTETLLKNGNLRYEVEYRATAGMTVFAFDPPDASLLQAQSSQPTSGGREIFTFEVTPSVMNRIQYITISFSSEVDEGCYWVYLEKNSYFASITEGNPVGEAQTLKVHSDRKVKVHSLRAQLLDNGFVRFTIEYTTSPGRHVSFFNPPYNDRFIYLSRHTATGERDTYMLDVPKADIDAVSDISVKFYDYNIGDHVYASFTAPRF